MDRRHFIKQSSLASGFFLLPGFLKPLERFSFAPNQRNLVVIQLSGGNDWLNTVIPFNNDIYFQKRPRLSLRDDKIIQLDKNLALNSAICTGAMGCSGFMPSFLSCSFSGSSSSQAGGFLVMRYCPDEEQNHCTL